MSNKILVDAECLYDMLRTNVNEGSEALSEYFCPSNLGLKDHHEQRYRDGCLACWRKAIDEEASKRCLIVSI